MHLDTFAKEYRLLLSTFAKECHLGLGPLYNAKPRWKAEQTFGIIALVLDGGMPHGRKPLY